MWPSIQPARPVSAVFVRSYPRLPRCSGGCPRAFVTFHKENLNSETPNAQMPQTGLRQRFSCPEVEGTSEDAIGFDAKNANNVSMALISLAKKTKACFLSQVISLRKLCEREREKLCVCHASQLGSPFLLLRVRSQRLTTPRLTASPCLFAVLYISQIESRRLRQLQKQYDAEVAAIAARTDKSTRLEYVCVCADAFTACAGCSISLHFALRKLVSRESLGLHRAIQLPPDGFFPTLSIGKRLACWSGKCRRRRNSGRSCGQKQPRCRPS